MKKYSVIAVLVLIAVLALSFFKSNSGTSTTGTTGSLAGEFSEGVHYRKVDSQNIAKSPDSESVKIQVQEFFWYGCPHCQNFEPAIRQYKKTLPDDAELVQIPVVWNEATRLHAAIHYVALESEDLEPLQDDLFEKIISIRKEGNLEKHKDEVESVFAAHGFSTDDFRDRLDATEFSPG